MRNLQRTSGGVVRRWRSRWGALFTVAVLLTVVLACGIRQDEFSCEDAVAHLQQCCPDFPGTNIQCVYNDNDGCGATYPDLDVDLSTCIRNEDCPTLRSSGVCTRAAAIDGGAATTGQGQGQGQGQGSAPPEITGVCP
jgi:hypothetical protein